MPIHFQLPGTATGDRVKARRWRIFWSYLPDWVITIGLFAIFYLLDTIDGYRRKFSITDTSLAYPYADPERIKSWELAIYAGIIPAVIIILTGALVRKSVWDVHSGILGFLLNLGLTVTFTDIIKITAGRPRPDLFDRCQIPDSITTNPVHGLVDWTICTRFDLLKEGFRSFPSGHSSFAWAGMWYLILYGSAKMHLTNRTGYTWKSWLLLAPLSAATLVSISRTMDYRHHATDVIAGGIIGILTAWFSYRQFYPPLNHPQAYKPYSPRISKDEIIPLHHTRTQDGQSHSTLNGRPSVDEPQSSLIPPPNAKSGSTARQRESRYGEYPPPGRYDAGDIDQNLGAVPQLSNGRSMIGDRYGGEEGTREEDETVKRDTLA